MARTITSSNQGTFPKCPTGIRGLDQITQGGIPRGRPTLVCGQAGCGKTLFSMEFLARGAMEFNEPGVFIAFEEKENELSENFASLGFDLEKLIAQKKLAIDHIFIERSEIMETGEYDLEGLFIRIQGAIESVGAKRIVIDTLEALFSGFSNDAILRAELRRLFRWLKDRGMTAIITGERGERMLTRQGLEEYVADCVILLEHLVDDQIATRRIRIVKYRGSSHGTNEYPFLIDEKGILILPITSLGLEHNAPKERISSGIPFLDSMLGGEGYFRGASILVSGGAGSGKTSVAAEFGKAACVRGDRTLFFVFEESPQQVLRNMHSIGLHLEPYIKKNLLKFFAARPSLYGLEMHLATMHKVIEEFKPQIVIVDPISNFISVGNNRQIYAMFLRLIDYLKANGTTALFTDLIHENENNLSSIGISSLADTWIGLKNLETSGERTRGLAIIKSRGMKHSNQTRRFIISDRGLQVVDI